MYSPTQPYSVLTLCKRTVSTIRTISMITIILLIGARATDGQTNTWSPYFFGGSASYNVASYWSMGSVPNDSSAVARFANLGYQTDCQIDINLTLQKLIITNGNTHHLVVQPGVTQISIAEADIGSAGSGGRTLYFGSANLSIGKLQFRTIISGHSTIIETSDVTALYSDDVRLIGTPTRLYQRWYLPQTMTIGGDFIVTILPSGPNKFVTLFHNNGTVIFNGSGIDSISTVSPLFKLIIEKPDGQIRLLHDLIIEDTLVCRAGTELDLNGFSLKCKRMLYEEGAVIYDSSPAQSGRVITTIDQNMTISVPFGTTTGSPRTLTLAFDGVSTAFEARMGYIDTTATALGLPLTIGSYAITTLPKGFWSIAADPALMAGASYHITCRHTITEPNRYLLKRPDAATAWAVPGVSIPVGDSSVKVENLYSFSDFVVVSEDVPLAIGLTLGYNGSHLKWNATIPTVDVLHNTRTIAQNVTQYQPTESGWYQVKSGNVYSNSVYVNVADATPQYLYYDASAASYKFSQPVRKKIVNIMGQVVYQDTEATTAVPIEPKGLYIIYDDAGHKAWKVVK